MSRKKAQLLTRDQYGCHVATMRTAELIQDQLSGRGGGGGWVLRLEDSSNAPWDDLTEEHPGETGVPRRIVWQIKRQFELLKDTDFKKLVQELFVHPALEGRLALYHLVEVRKMGQLGVLAELGNRLLKPGLNPDDELELSQRERKWLQILQKLTGGTEREVLAFIRRLDVRSLGREQDMERVAKAFLQTHFENPDAVHSKLMAFFAKSADGAIAITYELLQAQVLKDEPRRLVSGTPSLATARAAYLQAVVDNYQRQLTLRRLSGRGGADSGGPKLAGVFAMPALHGALGGHFLPEALRNSEPMGEVLPGENVEDSPLSDGISARVHDVQLVESLTADARLVDCPRFLVEGEVGTGKSTLLEHLAFVLAERARSDAGAPIPVKIDARLLAEDLATAVQRMFPALDARVLESHSAGFIYLVDGLDEVGQRSASAVQGQLYQLDGKASTRAMVLAGRPLAGYVQPPPGFNRLQVVPWSRAQVQAFLSRWREVDPHAIEALDLEHRWEALAPMLTQPLTATFALMLAREEPEALRSRSSLFQGIAEKLFHDWARQRSVDGRDAPMKWSMMARSFQRMALKSLRSEREFVSRSDLRQFLGRDAADAVLEWIDAAHLHFGLLVWQPDQTYRFVFKGLAEHLAGAALLQEGDEAMRKAAHRRWGLEPVRHAIGLGAEKKGRAWAIEFIRSLLTDSKAPHPQLRLLLVSAYATLDLGAEGAVLAEPVAEALCEELTLETSSWRAGVFANVSRELLRQDGPPGKALLAKLLPRLRAEGRLADWYAAQMETAPSFWLRLLSQKDPEVRCVAIGKLTAKVDEPLVRGALSEQLLDGTRPHFARVPAYQAGLALRQAKRDDDFAARLPDIAYLAAHGGQLQGGAAALALKPGEVLPAVLVTAFKLMAQGGWVYREVLNELAATDEGRAALELHWPDWNAERHSRPQEIEAPKGEPRMAYGSKEAPLSAATSRQLSRIVSPELVGRRLGLTLSREFLAGPRRAQWVCEEAWDFPEAAVAWLESKERGTLTQASEFLLGEAALRHPSLRKALLELWARSHEERDRQLFPGNALSQLVGSGDEEAARVFAEWLDVTHWLKMAYHRLFLWPAALQHPNVRPVAIQKALETWTEFEVGSVDANGKRTTLWSGVMASVLGALRPAWEGHAQMEDKLLQLAREGSVQQLTHVLLVYYAKPRPPELAEILVQRFETLQEEDHAVEPSYIATCINWAQHAGLQKRLRPSLERIVTWYSWPRYVAASVLVESSPSEQARQLSQRTAEHWPEQWDGYSLSRSVLLILQRANPEAWIQRLMTLLKDEALSARAVFELARCFTRYPEHSQRKLLLENVHRRLIQGAPPRWLQRGVDSEDSISFEDLFHQILFESDDLD
ncbi:NACHT domain-containing protein [Corallococcus exercitus]|uniref:NACHT domain-containing protein n=1 Tax=Corallococcus exercitus TaxID=2316736 RepID=UPI0011C400A7|nr:hypothetical protein [Corallococcus exercitus]